MVFPRCTLLRISTFGSFLLFLIVLGLDVSVNAQCVSDTLTGGLEGPSKLIQTPLANLIVAETGTPAPNSGRVSIVDLNGNRRF
jgi:hypothetical protein